VIVVVGLRSVLQSLQVVKLLSLREPGSGGLSPSVVEFKEHVVQMLVLASYRFYLVELRRNVAKFVKVLRSDLADVKINQVAVVTVNLVKLFLCKILGVHKSLDVYVLMRQNN
jgi:hypothetical protein